MEILNKKDLQMRNSRKTKQISDDYLYELIYKQQLPYNTLIKTIMEDYNMTAVPAKQAVSDFKLAYRKLIQESIADDVRDRIEKYENLLQETKTQSTKLDIMKQIDKLSGFDILTLKIDEPIRISIVEPEEND